MVVLVSKCRFIKSRIDIKTKKYLMAKSKMATISYENIPKRMMVLASKSGIRPSSDTMILLVIFSILGTSHPLVYQLVLTY